MAAIVRFEEQYRDDTIFCLLLAKDALGRRPRLNEDLLDIQGHYFSHGDMFWIALDESDRVVGMVGTKTVSPTDMWLKRLYVKPALKKTGIGSALLATAERYAAEKGITTIHTRFSNDYVEAACFYPKKGFIEHERNEGSRHLTKRI